MPDVTYQCSCGLREERYFKSKCPQVVTCSGCGSQASRLLPEINPVMDFKIGGPAPQNTGSMSMDMYVDRVIGQSAQTGWKAHGVREGEKREVLEDNPGKTERDLTENPDHSWGIMPVHIRDKQERARVINALAMKRRMDRKRNQGFSRDS